MFTFWTRMPVLHRLNWVFIIAAGVVLIGALIWHYPPWFSSLPLIASVIPTIESHSSDARHSPGARHPQENDPNRR